MRKMLRWLAVKLFGPPVCAGCSAYGVYCVGHCGMSDEERERAYRQGGARDHPCAKALDGAEALREFD